MSRPDVEAIEARCESAAPGPWTRDVDLHQQERIYDASGDDWIALLPHQCVASIEAQRTKDAAFIAAARTDVPRLCAYIRDLEAALQSLRAPRTKDD